MLRRAAPNSPCTAPLPAAVSSPFLKTLTTVLYIGGWLPGSGHKFQLQDTDTLMVNYLNLTLALYMSR